jgi:hypothetical protein
MLDPILRNAIDDVVRGAILENWYFYCLVASVVFLATVFGNAISAYARKRGETLATKADFEEILRQLRTSTKTTEDIRASVQHSDWVSREWKVVRRTKLEELLDAVYAAEHWLEACREKWIFKSEKELAPDPSDRVQRICALYFPELRPVVAALREAHRDAIMWTIDCGKALHGADQDPDARKKVFDSVIPTLRPHSKAVVQAIADVEAKAAELMVSIRAV